MIHRVTDFAASRRGKWITLAVWLIVSAIVTPLAPQLSEVTTNDESSFLPSGAESTRVAALIKRDFPSDGTPAIIVFRDADGLSERDLTQAKQVSDWLTSGAAGANVHDVVSIYIVPQAAEQLQSPDQTTMTMIVSKAMRSSMPSFCAWASPSVPVPTRADKPKGIA